MQKHYEKITQKKRLAMEVEEGNKQTDKSE
jgi:hypothetical protein